MCAHGSSSAAFHSVRVYPQHVPALPWVTLYVLPRPPLEEAAETLEYGLQVGQLGVGILVYSGRAEHASPSTVLYI